MKGKSPSKSVLAKNKPLWEHGKFIMQQNQKIGYFIKNFAITQTYSAFQKNKNILDDKEKEELAKMVEELKNDKKILKPEDLTCEKEEFYEFLENLFANVDDEDHHGEVTLKTSAKFKMLGELIEVVAAYEPIPEVVRQKRNILP